VKSAGCGRHELSFEGRTGALDLRRWSRPAAVQRPSAAVRRILLFQGTEGDEDSSIASSPAPENTMQTQRFNQVLSFSLAALITVGILAGINAQAQPDAAQQQMAQAATPKAGKS
jgi:hypothetical protein